jgi:hypothetical protein
VTQEKLKQVTSPRGSSTASQEGTGTVRVLYGVHILDVGVAGRTVLSVREALTQPLNISPQAVTLVNGREVESTHVLAPGELLEFVRHSGEKGQEAGPTAIGRDRAAMEERYGPLGSGRPDLTISGTTYDLYALLQILGLGFEDIKPIDAHVLAENLYALRYFDPEERSIVAYDFDAEFRRVGEVSVHIQEWMGDKYFEFNWGVWCPWTM